MTSRPATYQALPRLAAMRQRTVEAHAALLRELAASAGSMPSDPVERLTRLREQQQARAQARALTLDMEALDAALRCRALLCEVDSAAWWSRIRAFREGWPP